jgi:ribosome recycling factor
MIREIVTDAELRMTKSVEKLRQDLTHIRTGKASVGLVEPLKVEVYGTDMPLSQVASVSTPDSKTIVIQPWDRTVLASIEKSIRKSDLGLNPMSDGTLIRLAIPPLTEDRRKELVKLVKKYVEEAKVAVRNIRRDANAALKDLVKDKSISEDDERRGQELVQKLTDQYVKEVDSVLAAKETDLMAI